MFLACSGNLWPNLPQYKSEFWQFDNISLENRSMFLRLEGQQPIRTQNERNRQSWKFTNHLEIGHTQTNAAARNDAKSMEPCILSGKSWSDRQRIKPFLKWNESDRITYPQMPQWPTTRIKWISCRVVDPKCDCRELASSLLFYRATPHPWWEQKGTDR